MGGPIAEATAILRFSPLYMSNLTNPQGSLSVQGLLMANDLSLSVTQDLGQHVSGDASNALFTGAWTAVQATVVTPIGSTAPYVDVSLSVFTSSAALAPLLGVYLNGALSAAAHARKDVCDIAEMRAKTLLGTGANVTGEAQSWGWGRGRASASVWYACVAAALSHCLRHLRCRIRLLAAPLQPSSSVPRP